MRKHPRLLLLGSCLLVVASVLGFLGRSPDFDLEMTREVPSPSQIDKLNGYKKTRLYQLQSKVIVMKEVPVNLT